MKKYQAILLIIILAIFINIVSGCANKHQVMPSNRSDNGPTAGEYFVQQLSYLSLYEGETGFIQLHLIKVQNGAKNVSPSGKPSSFTLISNQGDIKTASEGYIDGSQSNNYLMQTLNLKMSGLKPGIYQVKSLKIVTGGKATTHPIGSWMIEVMPGKPPVDLEIGKHTLASVELDNYIVELKNTTKLPVKVESLYLNLNNKPIRIVPKVFRDFNIEQQLTEGTQLGPGEKYTFVFDYPRSAAGRFFMVKPRIMYSTGDVKRSLSLPAASYYPTLANDQEVLNLVNSISRSK